MAKTPAPAKTPTVAIARILRSLGLKQGTDFRVRGQYEAGQRVGAEVQISGQDANQAVADNADHIEQAAADAGFHFSVSIYFTPSGNVWVWVSNTGQRTRETHFQSPAEPTTEDSDVTAEPTIEDYAQAARLIEDLRPTGRARTLSEYLAERKQRATDAPKPVIRATLGEPRRAFGQPEPAQELDPYKGLDTRVSEGRTWGCAEAGKMWFFQTIQDTPNYILRAYLGNARAIGWYLSGPGIDGDRFMAGGLTTSMIWADQVISSFQGLTDAVQDAVTAFPSGQRVQGVDSYGVACLGTVNGIGWGVVTMPGHKNYGRAWADVTWDAMPHNRGTGRRSRPFVLDLIKH